MRKQSLGGRFARPVFTKRRSVLFIMLLLSVLVLASGAQADDVEGAATPVYPEPVIM